MDIVGRMNPGFSSDCFQHSKLRVSIYAGSNGSDDSVRQHLRVFLEPFTLPSTGMYAIEVNPNGVGTGTITLTLHDVPPDVTGSISTGGSALQHVKRLRMKRSRAPRTSFHAFSRTATPSPACRRARSTGSRLPWTVDLSIVMGAGPVRLAAATPGGNHQAHGYRS